MSHEREFKDLEGPRLLVHPVFNDKRGSFEKLFGGWIGDAIRPLKFNAKEVAISKNQKVGTVRGLHFQLSPFNEDKVLKCISGKVWDVVVDLREGSPNFGHWAAVELSSDAGHMLFIPEGFAHGFQTLTNNTTLLYLIGAHHSPNHVSGLSPFDPELNIPWPLEISKISDKDKELPHLKDTKPVGRNISFEQKTSQLELD